ncbi:fimbrial protein [Providencia sp. Je.9.19]|uniref:fimbrial protein n=2 Tax=unclassified Providencia TaxID=2633465 RepID=UPI003DA7F10E
MIVYQNLGRRIALLVIVYIFTSSTAHSVKKLNFQGIDMMTLIMGSVIATPCSIVMENRYQTINFSSLTLTMLSTETARELHNQPFIIELRDCGSAFSSLDHKTWTIRFMGHSAEYIHAFVLQGASQGLGVSVLDDSLNILVPGQNYPLSNNVLRQSKSGQTLFLRYFLRLELTGQPIEAGSYQGLIRFFIDYQ